MRCDDHCWRRVYPLLWGLVALMFHATALTSIYYWPRESPPKPAPLRVALIDEPNPYENGSADQPDDPQPDDAPADDEPSAEAAPPELAGEPEPDRDQPPAPAPLEPQIAISPPQVAMNVPPIDPPPVNVPPAVGQGIIPSIVPVGPPGVEPGLPGRLSASRLYGNRFGVGKQEAMARFGGTPAAAAAIADGLAWLAAHQEPDGWWDRAGFERRCPHDDRCGNAAIRRLDRSADIGLTALCLLAFLGDGHLPGENRLPYGQTTGRAISFLLSRQGQDGAFGVDDSRRPPDDGHWDGGEPFLMYNHSIATLALAEAYSLTGRADLVQPIRRAVRFLAAAQQPQGGWDYAAVVTNRNDTSVTGWAVMALKAVATAGLDPPLEALYRAAGHFGRATDATGRTWYADRGGGVRFSPQSGLPVFRFGPAMTAVGAYSRQLLGYRTSGPGVIAALNSIVQELPDIATFCRGGPACLHTEYYWYYATLAMFQAGGRHWAAWAPAIQRTLVNSQDRSVRRDGTRLHRYGSWAAYGANWGRNWGADGGRIYATAINVLSLEVFFRYLPLNEIPADYDYWPIVQQTVTAGNHVQRQAIINWLGQLRPQLAEPVLYRLIADESESVRFWAAVQLAMLGSPLAGPVIERGMNQASPGDRVSGTYALGLIRDVPLPTFGQVIEVDRERGLASFGIGPEYVGFGMPVAAYDPAGRKIARMTIASFDRQGKVAIGRMSPADRARWVQVSPGQQLRGDW